LGFGEQKKIIEVSDQVQYFQWLKLFLYHSLLWAPDILPKSGIYTTHIKKVIVKLYFVAF